jgi:hypothetical protein
VDTLKQDLNIQIKGSIMESLRTPSTNLNNLIEAFQSSPVPAIKLTNYFQIYTFLFGHLINTKCTFIEVGVLSGGSLFMWKKWLGKDARIIGIDLNPEALKWQEYGFEIYIGDQGDPIFWQATLAKIGQFDVLLDDGGHQSFQQIVTAVEALKFANKECQIVIEDTCTSFMRDFASHGKYSFLEYIKAATDTLTAKDCNFFDGQFPEFKNNMALDLYSKVFNIQFFSNIVALNVKGEATEKSELIWNSPSTTSSKDFRLEGKNQALINWPDPKVEKYIAILGEAKTKS